MRINDGGPAFPRPASEYTANGTLPDGNDAIHQQDGMSLRDYLAAKAMAALMAFNIEDIKDIGEMAYKIADAMLKARNRGGDHEPPF